MLDAAGPPAQGRGSDAVLVLENAARPDQCGQLVFGYAYAAANQVAGPRDAGVRPDIDAGMAKRAGEKGGNGDVGRRSARALDHVAAERELGDVELGAAQSAKKGL